MGELIREMEVETVGELEHVLNESETVTDEPWIINVILPPMGRTRTLVRVSTELSKGVGKTG